MAGFNFGGRWLDERRAVAKLRRLRPSPSAGALAAESGIGEQADGGFDALTPLLVRDIIGEFGDEPESAASSELQTCDGVRGGGIATAIHRGAGSHRGAEQSGSR